MLDPQKLSLEADPTLKMGGSVSRIHQQTAPQKGVRLQNLSRYSPLKGGLPLKFINQKGFASRFHQLDGGPQCLLPGGPPLEFINIQPQNRGSASRIHQHQTKNMGSVSRDNFYGSSGSQFVKMKNFKLGSSLEAELILTSFYVSSN